MSPVSGIRFLNRLARLYGIQTAYYDVNDQRQQASAESLLVILKALGASVSNSRDVRLAWRERRQELWQQPIEPVNILWDDAPPLIRLRLPLGAAGSLLKCHLKLETGEEHSWTWHTAEIPVAETAEVEGIHYVVKHLPLPERLPWGYHKLNLELPGRNEESLVISAPHRAYIPPAEESEQYWGAFLPLYALHTQKSWGSGDFSDLGELIDWVSSIGGKVVATLPLLAIFTDREHEISPYLPISRLFWNEFYLDINAVPELQECHSAQKFMETSFQDKIEALRNSRLVDYQQQMTLKRNVLEELSQRFFAGASDRLEELHRFAEVNPVVDNYARFRAAGEKYHVPWQSWPQPLRDGVLKEGDYNEGNRLYHLYVQWLARQQIEKISQKAKGKDVRLYLDLPLGVHPDGYDAWRERETFIPDTSTGAPPDTVFTRGQNWGFQPLHPERVREQHYRYTIAYLQNYLRYAGILRIDHVMGLHRLFCIPDGMEASSGVYLRYHAEELYAILTLESHRNKVIIVGEDLGTVPPYVRPAMNKHGLYRMYVVHYELASNRQKSLPPVPRNSVASLNTHDMHPFAALWQGLDINDRQELGLIDRKGVQEERRTRLDIINTLRTFLRKKGLLKGSGGDTFSALEACLSFLAESRAQIVLVNLEDLWLETKPQNVPSTRKEHPNWQRKALYNLEEFCQMPRVVDTLLKINELRKRSRRRL